MRENYLKSFFKSFGFIPLVIAVLTLVMGAYIAMYANALSATVNNIVTGGVLAILAGFAAVGLSGLKKEKVGIIDFIRVTGFLAGAIIAIIVAVKGGDHTLFLIIGIIAAVLSLVEIGIRFAKSQGSDESSFKNYFGSLAGTFNPLIILVVGTVLAILAGVFAKVNITESIDFLSNFSKYKYAFVGAIAALVLVLVLTGTDKESEVTVFDFLLASAFVAGAETTIAVIPAGLVATQVALMVLVVLVASAGGLLLRAVFYNKDKGYSNPAHKVRTYFKGVYETYDVSIAFCVSLFALFFVALSFAGQFGASNYFLNLLFKPSKDSAMTLNIIAVVLGVLGVLLTFVFRKFKDQNPVKTDAVLVGILFTKKILFTIRIGRAIFIVKPFFIKI